MTLVERSDTLGGQVARQRVAGVDLDAAAESFAALRRGVKHLLTGSGSGRELESDPDAQADVVAATKVDSTDVVPVLRDGFFVAR